MTAAFFILCGILEVWTLLMGLTRPPGKAWPWMVAFGLDCAVAIVAGTWILTNA